MAFSVSVIDTTGLSNTGITKVEYSINPSDALIVGYEARTIYGDWMVDFGVYVEDASLVDGQSYAYTRYYPDGTVADTNTFRAQQVVGATNVFYIDFQFFGGSNYYGDVRWNNLQASTGTFYKFNYDSSLIPFDPSKPAVLEEVLSYFNRPIPGSGIATVEIDFDGEDLVFESEMLGNTITRFIDDDAEVDMNNS